MKEFYTDFYAAIERSAAHHAFCKRVYGLDLGQHGFADVAQLDLVLEATGLCAGQRALDLGCGDGRIAEYLADRSGAHVTGLDYIPSAIDRARQRTADRPQRLAFAVGDINRLELPDAAFDVVVSIDTLYFSDDYATTLKALTAALRPKGRMAFLYSHGREPWVAREAFDVASTQPDRTPLARALTASGLSFRTWDLTDQDHQLARRRKAVLADLKAQFEAEGHGFIHDNRMGDAEGMAQAIEEGLHARYLYHVQT